MTWNEITVYVFFPVIGYLLGSIPFAWIIGKAHGVDIRNTGSKNIGATNLGRKLGRRFFWQAFFLDAAKGFFPVLTAALLSRRVGSGGATGAPGIPSWAPLLTAAGCFIGHIFPIYLKFRGGKGVATGFGAVLGFWPLFTIAGLIGGAIFVFMLMVYRYISLASIVAAAAFAALVAVLSARDLGPIATSLPAGQRAPLIAAACVFAAVILFRHRGNIRRLLKGTEPRVGQKEIEKSKFQPPA